MNDLIITITEPVRQYGEYAVYQGTYRPDAITAGHGHDVVMDFGGGDKIDLTAFDLDQGELPLSATHDGVTLDLSDHGGGTVFLQGLDAPPREDAFLVA